MKIYPLSKKLSLLGLSGLLSLGAIAQTNSEVTVRTDSTVVVSTDRYQVLTNSFWDNWYIGVAGGGAMYFGDHNKQMKFGERIAPVFSLQLGKWFTPSIGVRLAGDYGKVKGVTQNGSYSNGVVYDASKRLTEQEFSFLQVHADVLFNLSNMLAGYNENRVYSLIPYFGIGYAGITDEPKREEIAMSVGLMNAFRLGSAVDLTLDIKGSMVKDEFDGEVGGRNKEGILTAMLGLNYKFNKRNWDKPQVVTKTIQMDYDHTALNKLKEQVASLAKDNDKLRAQLAGSSKETVTEVVVENKVMAAPLLVTFAINKSTVSNEARVNLGYLATVIKEGPAGAVYKITGYADSGTGTKSINDRLARKRAEAIYNVLIKEFGVSASKLRVDSAGGVENMYYNDPRLSRAVLMLAD